MNRFIRAKSSRHATAQRSIILHPHSSSPNNNLTTRQKVAAVVRPTHSSAPALWPLIHRSTKETSASHRFPKRPSPLPIFVAAALLSSPLAKAGEPKQLFFVHGASTHGYGYHAYAAAFRMLARILNESVIGLRATVLQEHDDLTPLATADAIVLGSDEGRLVKELSKQLVPLMAKGIGLGCIHYTLDPGEPRAVAQLIEWIGGAYEQTWSVNPVWEAHFNEFPVHPVARGLRPFRARDEWYYHMRFAPDMKGITPILQAIPPEQTRQGPDGPHSGNSFVRARTGMSEIVAWVYERPDGGRGFGFTGMHSHWNWAQDSFRTCVLNALVWLVGAEVPENGVPSQCPTLEDLEVYLDTPRPETFKVDYFRKLLKQMNP